MEAFPLTIRAIHKTKPIRYGAFTRQIIKAPEMTEPHEELLQIADRLDRLAERGNEAAIMKPLEALKTAAEEIG